MKRYTDLFVDFDDTIYDTHGNADDSLPPLRIFSFDESLQKEFSKHTFITIPQQNNTQNSHQKRDLQK